MHAEAEEIYQKLLTTGSRSQFDTQLTVGHQSAERSVSIVHSKSMIGMLTLRPDPVGRPKPVDLLLLDLPRRLDDLLQMLARDLFCVQSAVQVLRFTTKDVSRADW